MTKNSSQPSRATFCAARFSAEHPYALRAKGTPEAVAQLTQKDLLAFRDRYLVAKNGVISVFGDVEGR